jgi:hypothetical protein
MTNQKNDGGNVATETGISTDRQNQPAPTGTISVNVGVPGNIRKLVLEGSDWTVRDVLKYAEIDHNGYDLRVGGQPVDLNARITDGQTVLLLRPVRGNTGTISVNVGVPGNIRKLVLEGSDWTVRDVLKYAEIDHNGYDLRVGGQPVDLNARVTDGQTILLLRPVRGN